MPISPKRLAELAAKREEDIDMSDADELEATFFAKAVLNRPGANIADAVRRTFERVPSIAVRYAQTGKSARANHLGMRPMQERAYEKRGEQYLLIKSPPASGKSRALMYIAL